MAGLAGSGLGGLVRGLGSGFSPLENRKVKKAQYAGGGGGGGGGLRLCTNKQCLKIRLLQYPGYVFVCLVSNECYLWDLLLTRYFDMAGMISSGFSSCCAS